MVLLDVKPLRCQGPQLDIKYSSYLPDLIGPLYQVNILDTRPGFYVKQNQMSWPNIDHIFGIKTIDSTDMYRLDVSKYLVVGSNFLPHLAVSLDT